MSERIVRVTTVLEIMDGPKVEKLTVEAVDANLSGGRMGDVLAASRALDRCRKSLRDQLDSTSIVRAVDTDPPCLSPQLSEEAEEEVVVLERFPGDDRPVTNPVDTDHAEVLADEELPGMWEKADFEGGETDRYANVTRQAPPVDWSGRAGG